MNDRPVIMCYYCGRKAIGTQPQRYLYRLCIFAYHFSRKQAERDRVFLYLCLYKFFICYIRSSPEDLYIFVFVSIKNSVYFTASSDCFMSGASSQLAPEFLYIHNVILYHFLFPIHLPHREGVTVSFCIKAATLQYLGRVSTCNDFK